MGVAVKVKINTETKTTANTVAIVQRCFSTTRR